MSAKRKSYTSKFKLQVLEYSKEVGNCAAGRQFNVSESNVREWRNQEDMLQRLPEKKRANRGGCAQQPAIENMLCRWINKKQREGVVLTSSDVRVRAMKIFYANYGEEAAGFQASPVWCQRFLHRKGLSLKAASKEDSPPFNSEVETMNLDQRDSHTGKEQSASIAEVVVSQEHVDDGKGNFESLKLCVVTENVNQDHGSPALKDFKSNVVEENSLLEGQQVETPVLNVEIPDHNVERTENVEIPKQIVVKHENAEMPDTHLEKPRTLSLQAEKNVLMQAETELVSGEFNKIDNNNQEGRITKELAVKSEVSYDGILITQTTGNQQTDPSEECAKRLKKQVKLLAKKKRLSYRTEDKLEMVEFSKVHGKNPTSRKFGVSEANVRYWCKIEETLRNTHPDKLSNRGCSFKSKNLRNNVYDWVVEQQNLGRPLMESEIKEKAVQIYNEMPGSIPGKFKASSQWLTRFIECKGLSRFNPVKARNQTMDVTAGNQTVDIETGDQSMDVETGDQSMDVETRDTTHEDKGQTNSKKIGVTRKGRATYTREERLKVVEYSFKHGINAAWKDCGVPRSCIQLWRKQDLSKKTVKEIFDWEQPTTFPDLEQDVYEWICQRRERGNDITLVDIMQVAMMIFHEKYSAGNPSFKVTNNWCYNLMRRRGISVRKFKTEGLSSDDSDQKVFEADDTVVEMETKQKETKIKKKDFQRHPSIIEVEKELCEWIRMRLDDGLKTPRRKIRQKALELFETKPQKASPLFRASDEWCYNFLIRNDLHPKKKYKEYSKKSEKTATKSLKDVRKLFPSVEQETGTNPTKKSDYKKLAKSKKKSSPIKKGSSKSKSLCKTKQSSMSERGKNISEPSSVLEEGEASDGQSCHLVVVKQEVDSADESADRYATDLTSTMQPDCTVVHSPSKPTKTEQPSASSPKNKLAGSKKSVSGKRVHYEAQRKLEIVAIAENEGSTIAGHKFGVPESTIRAWLKRKKRLEEMPKTKLANRGYVKGSQLVELEDELANWVLMRKSLDIIATPAEIRETALRIYRAKTEDDNFRASANWCYRFMDARGFPRNRKSQDKDQSSETDSSE